MLLSGTTSDRIFFPILRISKQRRTLHLFRPIRREQKGPPRWSGRGPVGGRDGTHGTMAYGENGVGSNREFLKKRNDKNNFKKRKTEEEEEEEEENSYRK